MAQLGDHCALCSLACVNRQLRRLAAAGWLWQALCFQLPSPERLPVLAAADSTDWRSLYVRLSLRLRRERIQAHTRRILRARSALANNVNERARLQREIGRETTEIRALQATKTHARVGRNCWLPNAVAASVAARDAEAAAASPWLHELRLQEIRERRQHALTLARALQAREEEAPALESALEACLRSPL